MRERERDAPHSEIHHDSMMKALKSQLTVSPFLKGLTPWEPTPPAMLNPRPGLFWMTVRNCNTNTNMTDIKREKNRNMSFLYNFVDGVMRGTAVACLPSAQDACDNN